MSSRILLVNFTEKEAEKLKSLNVDVEIGYISDAWQVAEEEETSSPKPMYIGNVLQRSARAKTSTRKEENVNFYFPHPIYEYKVAVFNLNRNSESEAKFADKTKTLSQKTAKELLDFWWEKGVLIALLGDYNWQNLYDLGIPWVHLEKVDAEDVTCRFLLNDKSDFRRTLKDIRSSVLMPTQKYISIPNKEKYYPASANFSLINIYDNRGDKILGCYHNDSRYSSYAYPSFIILPQFRNNISVITVMLKAIAKIYPELLPEIYQPDWVDSDKYYPAEVSGFDKKISGIIANVQKDVETLSAEKERVKNKWSHLRGLLSKSGDALKSNVIQVLREVFKLSAEDVDKEKKSVFAEDILITYKDKKILAEVKGTADKNPSPTYITQVWKHLQRSECRDMAEGMLILNYDLKTDPDERSAAYTGEEEEKQVNDIIFMDTRVLYRIAIAVIDQSMPVDQAQTFLLKKGRVSFDLEEYLKSKTP